MVTLQWESWATGRLEGQGIFSKFLYIELKVSHLVTWPEPQATEHKSHSSPMVSILCHYSDILIQVPGICHGERVRRYLHLGRRTLDNEMCLLLPTSSPSGALLGWQSGSSQWSNWGCKEYGGGSQGPGFKVLAVQPRANQMSLLWLSWFLMYTGGRIIMLPSNSKTTLKVSVILGRERHSALLRNRRTKHSPLSPSQRSAASVAWRFWGCLFFSPNSCS